MKSVLFICLLSLSLSLSQPTNSAVTPDNHLEKNSVATKVETSTEAKPAAEQAKTPIQVENKTETAQNLTPQTQATPSSTNKTQTGKNETIPNETATKPLNPEQAKGLNTTNTEKKINETTTPAVEDATKDAKNDTKKEEPEKKPADGKEAGATTDKKIETTSEKPKYIPPVRARAFDSPSFFGGIILTLGLLAIGFMGYKYYKNQTDGNYHTL